MPRRHRERTRRGARNRTRARDIYLPHLSDGHKERDERTIWLGGLAVVGIEAKEELADIFQSFGSVTHIHIHEEKRFAFVHFAEEAEARAAVDADTVSIRGHEIQVRMASKTDPKQEGEDEQADAEAEEDAASGAEEAPEAVGEVPVSSTLAAEPDFDLATAEENIQALRVACIHCLESLGQPEMLHELGMDQFIQEHKQQLPSLSFVEFIRSFPDNFSMEDQGNGRFLITLLSSDYDDIDISTVEQILKRSSAAKSRIATIDTRRREEKREKKKMKFAAKVGLKESRREQFKNKLSERSRGGAPAGDAKSVVASDLSDGWRPRTDRTVWIGSNLPHAIRSKHDVADCIQPQFGPVTHIHVEDNLSFGFVHFEHPRDAQRAVDVGSVEMFGRRVEIKRADGNSGGGASGSSADAGSSRRHARNGIRVPDLPPRSGSLPAPGPVVVPRRTDLYPPLSGSTGQTPPKFGGAPRHVPARRLVPAPRQVPAPQQPQSRRPDPDPVQRRPTFGGAPPRGGSARPVAALPAPATRAAAPRPSMAPHLAGRPDPKRRRLG